MRNTIVLAVIVLFFSFWSVNSLQAQCEPNHGADAIKLIERLKRNQEAGNTLFGHHDDLLCGYRWQYNQDSRLFEQSDIKDVAGDYPAILGFDLGSIEYYGLKFERGNAFAAMIEAIKIHHARGGIVTISAHMRNVLTGESAWDVSRSDVVWKILHDKNTRKRFYDVLDLYCEFFSHLVDSTGAKIPVLFRPWHECNLSCFWWGPRLCTDRDYKRLWLITYNYIVKKKKIDNLVWVYSPSEITNKKNFNKRYPGDAYVDVIGFECYQHLYKNETIAKSTDRFSRTMNEGLSLLEKLTKRHNKIGAVTEVGFASVPDPNWWTGTLSPIIKNYSISYLYIWGNRYQSIDKVYGPYLNSPDSFDFAQFAKTKQCVLLNGMK